MDADPTNDDHRKVLKQLGEEIRAKSQELASFSAELNRKATEYLDIGTMVIQASEFGSELGDWEVTIGNADRLNAGLANMLPIRDQFNGISPSTNTSGSIVASGVLNLVSSQYYTYMPPEQVYKAQYVAITVANFYDRYGYRQRARDLITRFYLEDIIMRKFDASWEAFLQSPLGVDVSISAMIPLRESIQLMIDKLIQHRPTQKPVDKKSKIIEIGDQLHEDSISPDLFVDLNTEYRDLTDQLSGAKDNILDRTRQEELLRRGTSFIVSLLGALNPTKMRRA